jgi:hypothetical protein
VSALKCLGQPQGPRVSQETLVSATKSLKVLRISCQKPGSAMEHLDHSQGIWVSHEILVSALKYLGKLQGLWITQETLVSATKYLDKLPKTWVSHGTLGSDSGYLDQP